jgi:hypothetical protein
MLNRLMDLALGQIMLVSDGRVSSYVAVELVREPVDATDPMQRLLAAAPQYQHGGIAARSRAPESDLAAVIYELGERYAACKTHRRRLLVIKDAQAAAKALKYSPNRARVRGTPEWHQAIARDPRPSHEVALAFRTSPSTVKRIKSANGTSGARGRPKKDHNSSRPKKDRNLHAAVSSL